MVTLWDFNPTSDELKRLGVDIEFFSTITNQDAHLEAIASLIGIRGGSVSEQMVYVNQIQNPDSKRDWILLLHELG